MEMEEGSALQTTKIWDSFHLSTGEEAFYGSAFLPQHICPQLWIFMWIEKLVTSSCPL